MRYFPMNVGAKETCELFVKSYGWFGWLKRHVDRDVYPKF